MIFNLRLDPYERASITSNTYYDWLLDHSFAAGSGTGLCRPVPCNVQGISAAPEGGKLLARSGDGEVAAAERRLSLCNGVNTYFAWLLLRGCMSSKRDDCIDFCNSTSKVLMRRLGLIGFAAGLFINVTAGVPVHAAGVPDDGSVLPFPPAPSASVAAQTLQESKLEPRIENSHLPKDAPNILIILLDDVGFGLPDTYGGPIHTPTLSRIANEGISYDAFHTTSICSPTRGCIADRPQSPARRFRHNRRAGRELGRIYRRDPADLRHPCESARRLWLRNRSVRQMAQHPGDRDNGDGAVHALADRRGNRLRLFLRLSWRRDLAMGAEAVREPQSDRATARRQAIT